MCDKILRLNKGKQIDFGADVQGIFDRYQVFLDGMWKLYEKTHVSMGNEPCCAVNDAKSINHTARREQWRNKKGKYCLAS